MTHTKPATQLPWATDHIGVSDAGPNGDDVFDIGPKDFEGEMRKRVATVAGDDAAYIVAACNAYPELVAALRMITSMISAQGQRDAISEARALLAKLGEAA